MRKLLLLAVGAMLLCTVVAQADTGYNIGVTTFYQFGCPAGAAGACGSPDTSFVTITNNGASSFSGTIGTVAVSNFSGNLSVSYVTSLAPGGSFTFNPASYENSNFGGFNGCYGCLQPGIQIYLNGSFTNGSNTTGALNLSVNDADIHSGVPQVNPFGVTVDSWVLQGGDPYGRDTGDGFEVSQAAGHYSFIHNVNGQVPEPASLALLGSGLIGLAGRLRKRFQ